MTSLDIAYNFRLSMKFSVHIMNSARAKIWFSFTNYFRSIVVLIFALTTLLCTPLQIK